MNVQAQHAPFAKYRSSVLAILVVLFMVIAGLVAAAPAAASDSGEGAHDAALVADDAAGASAPHAETTSDAGTNTGAEDAADVAEGAESGSENLEPTADVPVTSNGAGDSLDDARGEAPREEGGDSAPSDAESAEIDATVPPAENAPTWTPEIVVELADGTPVLSGSTVYEGDVLVVKGSGFDPLSHPALGRPPVTAGDPSGNYVVFGNFAERWRPSEGVASSERKVVDQRWAMTDATFGNLNPRFVGAVAGDRVVLTEAGTFEAELTVAEADTLPGSYGVFTYVAGGGANDPTQELELRLTYSDQPRPAAPEIVVELADGTPVLSGSTVYEGDVLVVKGSGFDPLSHPALGRPPVTAGDPSGNYVVFGNFAERWRPSEGVASSERKVVDQRWAMTDATFGNLNPRFVGAVAGDRVVLTEAGTFEAELTVAEADTLPGSYGVFTYVAGGGANDPTQELELRLTYSDQPRPETPTPGQTPDEGASPTEPATPAQPVVRGGSLRWAISSGFANYVTGPIAQGAIAVSGGATRSGGQFQFGQAPGSTYNAATGAGTVSYVGSVRFTGHHGALDVTVSNPQIVISPSGAATLWVTRGGARIDFATLNLAAGAKIEANGAVSYNAVPASLTSAGLNRVLEGYATSLNPVSFTIGAAAAAPAGSTGTVASAVSAGDKPRLPSTPPATTGIEVDSAQMAAFAAGDEGTFAASGFQPDEEDIQVVVYSTPVLLDTVTADAQGVATWTGAVPATLADGPHTLTFQGSVTRGLEFTLSRGVVTAAFGTCLAEDATLNWGFKEGFRTYIEGIGQGGWELSDVEYAYPDFVWSAGSGSLDADAMTGLITYGGDIRFQGHGGVLDTTLSNARVELAGERGYVVFDVAGTTQSGEPVEQADVRFAEFSLDGVEIADGTLTLGALPATLTDAGAAAFGTYAAGEELDPVSAVIPVGADCGVAAEAVAVEAEEEPVVEAESDAAADAPVWPWIAGGIVLALLIGIGVGVGVGRGRKNTDSPA